MSRNKPYLIGLTGGIASGKDLVCRFLEGFGVKIIDADKVYQGLIKPGSDLLKAIAEEFGEEYFNPEGSLNKKALGGLVFGDSAKLKLLNSITHPAITTAIKVEIDQIEAPLVVLSAPLLLETRLPLEFDEIWVVAVPEELQIERLMYRDQISREQAEKKIKSQMPLEEKVKTANLVIDNSGSEMETGELVAKALKALLEWRKIFDFTDDNYCFACGELNPIGLKLRFEPTEKGMRATFIPQREHQGFKGVVHGGIIMTLLDETMANLALAKGFPALTGKLECKFHRPGVVGEPIEIKAEILREAGKLLEMEAKAFNPHGEVLTEGKALFVKVKAVGNFLEGKNRRF